ncbi:hypothetical protein CEXT_273151 [Caerostris extrusa]|uniref:Uncharacterized protein n=1 Tax=Caerostris extrusa TaxID=172846 RepID=A0AAV4MAG8_CAEEX|nr:hypothetical protein CEXT_273151 [Caerostris extrusa]
MKRIVACPLMIDNPLLYVPLPHRFNPNGQSMAGAGPHRSSEKGDEPTSSHPNSQRSRADLSSPDPLESARHPLPPR